jgi:hypothetical protein
MNTYTKIATLIELHSTLVEHSNPIPTPDLAIRAAQLAIDEQFNGCVYRMAAGSYLRAAILWGRISDLVTTKARFDTLVLAAVFAHNSRNLYLAANYVAQLERLSHSEGFEIPATIAVLERNHAFREICVNATPSYAIQRRSLPGKVIERELLRAGRGVPTSEAALSPQRRLRGAQ